MVRGQGQYGMSSLATGGTGLPLGNYLNQAQVEQLRDQFASQLAQQGVRPDRALKIGGQLARIADRTGVTPNISDLFGGTQTQTPSLDRVVTQPTAQTATVVVNGQIRTPPSP